MKKIRLRTFIILSLVLHLLLITALVAIFLPKRGILRNVQTPISVGILTQNNGIDKAKDNSLDSIARAGSKQKETPKVNEPREKGIFQAYDNEKTIKKIDHDEEKTIPKEHVTDIASVSPDSSVIETETTNNKIAFSDADRETNNQTTARISGNENMNHKRDSGTDSLNRNIERAFPDYKVNPKPRYPMLARRKGYEGTILLRVFVLESGGVGKVELEKSSGYEILDESAFKAVKDWVFIPGKKNGEPVPSWVTVPIRFQLNSG
jgi:TonB family protein